MDNTALYDKNFAWEFTPDDAIEQRLRLPPIKSESMYLYFATKKIAMFSYLEPSKHWTDTSKIITCDTKPDSIHSNSLKLDHELPTHTAYFQPFQSGSSYFKPTIADVLNRKIPWVFNTSAGFELWSGMTLAEYVELLTFIRIPCGINLNLLKN